MLFILPPAPSLLFHVMERGRKPCQLSDTTINTVAAVFFSSPHPTPTKRPVFVARCMVTKREEVKQNFAAQYMDTHVLSPPNRPDVVPRRDGSINVSSV